MTISLTCGCGVRLEIDESFAGQTINCPDCQRSITAPKPEQEGLRTSGFALGSLTLALVGAFTVVGTLLAVVLGFLGLQGIRRAPDRLTGRGFALAGIGLGVALTAVTLIGLIRGDLFGLGGWYGAQRWSGKLDYDGPDEIVRPMERFAITRPSRKWGVYRSTANAGRIADPPGHVWDDDLLLVNVGEDAHILVIAKRVDVDKNLEACRSDAVRDFRENDRGGLFGGPKGGLHMGRTEVLRTRILEPIGMIDMVEMDIDKSVAGQERRFIMRVLKEREDREGIAFVVIGGARKSHFARVEPDLRKAISSFRVLVRGLP